MPHMPIIHEVQDYESWKLIFDQAADMRREAGECSYQVLHYENDPKKVVYLSKWTSLDHAKAFFESERVLNIRKAAGVKSPEFIYLEELEAGAVRVL